MKYTTDIWFASFLVRRGHPVADLLKEKRTKIGFELSEEKWKAAKLAWGCSPDIDIKYAQEKIKDLIFQ